MFAKAVETLKMKATALDMTQIEERSKPVRFIHVGAFPVDDAHTLTLCRHDGLLGIALPHSSCKVSCTTSLLVIPHRRHVAQSICVACLPLLRFRLARQTRRGGASGMPLPGCEAFFMFPLLSRYCRKAKGVGVSLKMWKHGESVVSHEVSGEMQLMASRMQGPVPLPWT
jgi:hypothetical protein